jgi:iron complex transport system substrate-binding protein
MRAYVLILVMMSCLLQVALPTGTADSSLGVFGNANMDDTIDEKDIEYLRGIIDQRNKPTELADANNDSKIDSLDIDQINKIINGEEKQLTYINVFGEPETVNKPIERIADVSAGFATETVRALNATDKIIAVTKTIAEKTSFFPELVQLPLIAGNWNEPDFEAILNQHPDTVITYIPWEYNWALNVGNWKKNLPGVQIISLGFINPIGEEYTGADGVGKYNGLIESTRKLGYILDKEKEAEDFCNWYEGWLNIIKVRTEKTPDNEKKMVYTEWGSKEYYFLKGRHHQICTLAGGIDLLSDLPTTSGQTDPEWVIKKDPDVIIKARSAGFGGGYDTDNSSGMKAIRDIVLNRPELANVKALKNGNVYAMDPNLTNGPRTIVAIAYTAKWLYPDLFKDLDPQAIHQEYLSRFQHLDFDLNKMGVFIYPPFNES